MHGKKEQNNKMTWKKMWKAFGADWRAEQVGTQFPSLSLKKGRALGS
jgi:hypothetical protein